MINSYAVVYTTAYEFVSYDINNAYPSGLLSFNI